jgi:sulfite reductase alpha subunit-like flavoprotein
LWGFQLTLDRVSREDRRKAPCPSPCVVRDALAWHVDLGSPPKVALLDMFAALASDEKEAAELKKLSTPSNKAEYQKQIVQPHLSLVDVLEKYASVKLSLDQLLEYAPKLLPRYYTIASSSKVQPQRVAIAVSGL